MLKFYAIYNNDHLYHKCDQMILLVASAASSSTKIRSLSHFYVWTEQTCFSLCKQTLSVSAFYTNRLSAPTAWVWQLQETRNLPYQPWCRHKPHCVHSQKSGVVQIWHMYAYVFQNLRKNQYMLSCMVVSGLVPTSAICHGVCKWCAFELKTTQLSELTASYMLIMLFCVWTVLPKTLGVDKFGCIPTWWGRSLLSMPFVDVRNLPGEFLCRPAPPPHHTHLTDRHKPGMWEAQHKPQFQQLLLVFNLYDHNLACLFCLNLSSTVQRNYPKLRRQAST